MECNTPVSSLAGEEIGMMTKRGLVCLLACALAHMVGLWASVSAQGDLATVTGRVFDPNAAVIVEATVTARNVDTGIETVGQTNEDGIYRFVNLGPGNYEISVSKKGFKVTVKPGVTLHVADTVSMNFTMQVGSVSETVRVEGGAPLINTESAAVSTVVDRQFAENLPMNGRSFQTLIQLAPGVVVVPTNNGDGGQFSVSGQRASSNYWMVDGVSANIGISAFFNPGNGVGGALGSFSILGGTNSLVSVDALQEFRIQTSTYAPEFGRTPGGQISILTRSGANQFHGTLFNYFRNDVLDANDWFADSKGLRKPEERQNDFGGTFSGPVLRDRTFFFFSYEGLRLRLPQTALDAVPDLNARQSAKPAVQPILNAFPLPNGSDNVATGVAQFNASFSNPATLDAYSIRIDHKLSNKLNLFGRYNYSPSEVDQRGSLGLPLSDVAPGRITTQTATVGATWAVSPAMSNDVRFNYSRTNGSSSIHLDTFGGAVPVTSLPLPSPFAANNSLFFFDILGLNGGNFFVGDNIGNRQRQINLVDDLSIQKGSHGLKFGIDFRRLSPSTSPRLYEQDVFFFGVSSAKAGDLAFGQVVSQVGATFLFRNLSIFAQDTWRIIPRLTLTYGLRWDVDFAPSTTNGPNISAVTGFNLNNLSALRLAPVGTSPYDTKYGNVAPRLGVAYQFSQNQDWQTVLRGGFGVFFDLATSEVGNLLNLGFPFYATNSNISGPCCGGTSTFPLSPSDAAPPPITQPGGGSGTVSAFDPNLQLPYTLQWNVAIEQALGRQQSASISYIGATGRRLIQSAFISSPNPNYASAQLVTNMATSDYNALQFQFQRRLSHGLQALASYTWAHSIDTASAGSAFGNAANALVPVLNANANRGPSDFDIRNAFSAGVTYDIPAPKINAFTNAILRGWSLQNVIQARSAPPVNVFNSVYGFGTLLNSKTPVRPDMVPGIPVYLYGSQYPGGKAINNTPGAVQGGCPDGSQSVGPFCPPPMDANGNPLRQGNLGRNAVRGFGTTQWDFAVHRDFPIKESLRLQFRAELFNVLNHPNFGQPVVDLSNSNFGRSIQMLGQSLGGSSNLGAGGFDSLYQIGGPRSVQLALKLTF